MFTKKDIKTLTKLQALANSCGTDRKAHADTLCEIIDEADDVIENFRSKLNANEVFECFNCDDGGLEKDDKGYYHYFTSCGNVQHGLVNGVELARMLHRAVCTAEQIYREHRIDLVAKSTEKKTAYGKTNLLAFYIGNCKGVMNAQRKAETQGTHSFFYYERGGYEQALDDEDAIEDIKNGKPVKSPLEHGLSNEAVAKNVMLGRKIMKKAKKNAKAVKAKA